MISILRFLAERHMTGSQSRISRYPRDTDGYDEFDGRWRLFI